MHLSSTPILLLITSLSLVSCDYIQSNEITLYSDAATANTKLIDLNELLTANNIKTNVANLFKLVQDTALANHVLIDQSAQVLLGGSFAYGELCSNNSPSCVQTLKIIAINDNHFIEIPVSIRRGSAAQTTTPKPLEPLYFEQPSYSLELLDNLEAGHLILMPQLSTTGSQERAIVFSLTEENPGFFVNASSGGLGLRKAAWDLLRVNTSLNLMVLEKTVILSIKATYEQAVLNSSVQFSYMLPAFAKVIVNIKHAPANITMATRQLNNLLQQHQRLVMDLFYNIIALPNKVIDKT
jgi:hypothetical protein